MNILKRIVAVSGLLALTALALNAQQNLFVAQDIESPVVHEDGSVTFSFLAPDARKVQISGDFVANTEAVQHVNGMVGAGLLSMTKGEDGVWTYTTSPLPSELYSYEFIVDGVPTIDPNNVYVYRDFATITNVFLVGGGQADLYKVNDVPHGTMHYCWYDSEAIGTDRRLSIYTPAGYEQSGQSYPVLYLLHGMGGDEGEWVSFGRTAQIMDNLTAQGLAEPAIVVMPNGHAGMEAAPGESSLGYYKPHYMDHGTMDGVFEASFPEIINYVETNYRAKTDKASRAIAGLSMGGFHAAVISMNNPDLFDYVGVFSSTLLLRDIAASTLGEESQSDDSREAVYGDNETKLKVQFADKTPKLYWLGIGSDDFLYERNAMFRALLDEKGYGYEFLETPGAHVWTCWRTYLSIFAQKIFK